ncbi:ABC transporter permease [Candidatus Poriferisodalis sp.]|uniref:ABC transporter permease n=1 Tax=Candidatus Poriferisodalis sp. TaxID=3101277 RepID=UPI003B0248CC
MSAAALLAQANGEEAEKTGHFIDRFIDAITAPEAGDRVADWLATGIEWTFLLAVAIVVPALLLLGGARGRRYGLAAGGLVGLLFVWWYRSRPEQIVASGVRKYRVDGEIIECRDAVVDAEDELVECSSSVIAQVRQSSVLDNWQISFGEWFEQSVFWVNNNMKATLEIIEWPFRTLTNIIVNQWLLNMSWLTICIAILILGWCFRSFQVGLMAFAGLLVCGLLGEAYWRETALTLGFIGVSVLLCVIIGIPIGVLCGRVDAAWNVVRPVLDAMQVVHSFVYMLPFVFFFGVGNVTGTMLTMTFALPPLIRLTNLGIRQVPEDVVEASRAYGAPEWRVLTDVQLPLARPAIMTGLNQTLLLAISMLGVAAIAGVGGLGRLLLQAISNTDAAQAGAGGLAFFLVAVVLDRLSQPEAGDSGNLLTRIAQAWRHRRTPEELLADDEAAGASQAKPDLKPMTPDEAFVEPTSRERIAVGATALGSLVALTALLLPWNIDAGLVSGYARSTDVDLRTEQCSGNWVDASAQDSPAPTDTAPICDGEASFISNSFNGVSASGGSWFGIIIGVMSVFSLLAALRTLLRPGEGSRWMSSHGAIAFAGASAITAAAHLLARPANDIEALGFFSRGSGAYLAVVGTLIAAIGAVAWLWLAPMTARTPLPARVSWGRMFGAMFAVALLVMGGYAGWSFDTRIERVVDDELAAQLDEIETKGREAAERAADARAAADEAAAAGDITREEELRRVVTEAQREETAASAELAATISTAQRKRDVIHDGFEEEGAGLGIWSLLAGLAAVVMSVPAIGLTGIDETRRYRWSALVGAVGAGIAAISMAWVLSITRVADPDLVSGVGVALVMAAGVTVFATARRTLSEFERNKIYGDIPVSSQ